MKPASLLLFFGALQSVSAHYVFAKFIFNGQTSRDFEYVRRNTNNYMPTKFKNIPETSISPESEDFRCNAGSFANAANTKTASVKAGDEVGFQLAYGASMQHPGPLQVYMSRAPGSVGSYKGDGDWFKIHQELVCSDMSGGYKDDKWCTWDFDTKKFKIPAATPDGEYLLRIEHIALHGAHDGQAEFYYTCAQVKVTGGGNGSPGPTVKIPGIYKRDSPEVNFSIWNNPKSYPFIPGVDVWSEGTVVGSANGKTGRAVTGGKGTSGGNNTIGNGSSSAVEVKPSTTFSTKIKNVSTTSGSMVATTTAQMSALPITMTSQVPTISSVDTAPTQKPSVPGVPGDIKGRKYVCYELDD